MKSCITYREEAFDDKLTSCRDVLTSAQTRIRAAQNANFIYSVASRPRQTIASDVTHVYLHASTSGGDTGFITCMYRHDVIGTFWEKSEDQQAVKQGRVTGTTANDK